MLSLRVSLSDSLGVIQSVVFYFILLCFILFVSVTVSVGWENMRIAQAFFSNPIEKVAGDLLAVVGARRSPVIFLLC